MSGEFILVVDDEPDIRTLLQEILEDEGFVVQVAEDAATARAMVAEVRPQLVLLDIWMPDEDGVSLLKSWSSSGLLQFPVVMISGHGTIETAVEATRVGAVDFIEKPLSLAKLLLTVEKALHEAGQFAGANALKPNPLPLLAGDSDFVQKVMVQLEKLSAVSDSVLLYGPVGSGRDILAREIHARSSRASEPFVHLRSETLSAANFERELFGAEINGSVSGGYFDSAANGTIFIDNAEMLPQGAHASLLGLIEQNEFLRVDGSQPQKLSARLITATRQSPSKLVAEGLFTNPLIDKLSVASVELLPLAGRAADVPVLLEKLVEWHVEAEGLTYRHFTVAAQNRLRNYSWPGNLPELKNLVQRALILGGPTEIDTAEADRFIGESRDGAGAGKASDDVIALRQDLPLREARALFEREYLTKCLLESRGNMGDLARHVGMERTHLYRKLRSLDIDLEKARE